MNHVRDFKDHLKYFFSNLNEEGLTLWLQAYHQLENMTYILTLAGKICNSLLGLWNLNVEIQNPFSVSRMPSLSQLGKWLFSLTVKKKKNLLRLYAIAIGRVVFMHKLYFFIIIIKVELICYNIVLKVSLKSVRSYAFQFIYFFQWTCISSISLLKNNSNICLLP